MKKAIARDDVSETHVELRRFPERSFVRQVLVSWSNQIVQYNEIHGMKKYDDAHDAAYVHGERVNVSVLAAAAWRSGGVATEEYATVRRGAKKGRGDLFFSSYRTGFSAEAKVVYPTFAQKKWRYNKMFDLALTKARQDAKKINTTSEYKIGICFIVPRVEIAKSKKAENNIEFIEPHIRNVCQSALEIDWDGIAWAFPRRGRHIHFNSGNESKRYFYPGVIILIRKA